jgi:uncharacterized Tic20 family protein
METLDENNKNMPSADDNQMAMWGHLIGLLSCMNGFYGLIGTLVFYLINRDKNPFVKHNATNALNFQITFFIISMIIGFLFISLLLGSFLASNQGFATSTPSIFAGVGVTFIMNTAFFIINLIGCIRAAMAANKGGIWQNPLAVTFFK